MVTLSLSLLVPPILSSKSKSLDRMSLMPRGLQIFRIFPDGFTQIFANNFKQAQDTRAGSKAIPANNCHHPGYPEQRPFQISILRDLCLSLSQFYFIIPRDRQQTELRCPGVHEFCLAIIFLLLCVTQLRYERHPRVYKLFLNAQVEFETSFYQISC